ACYGIKIDHTERETTGVVGKAERLTWHKAWTMVSTGFSISYTSRLSVKIKAIKEEARKAPVNKDFFSFQTRRAYNPISATAETIPYH
ncbi:hypothetical protein KSI21_23920, partial [Salmonella enterica subsp. enterica serovar Indiana]|nr:hypothetical protein [Salmonella enterica subsp. enterica serovar Indiana]